MILRGFKLEIYINLSTGTHQLMIFWQSCCQRDVFHTFSNNGGSSFSAYCGEKDIKSTCSWGDLSLKIIFCNCEAWTYGGLQTRELGQIENYSSTMIYGNSIADDFWQNCCQRDVFLTFLNNGGSSFTAYCWDLSLKFISIYLPCSTGTQQLIIFGNIAVKGMSFTLFQTTETAASPAYCGETDIKE